ncbi:ATP-binding cassette domain-containing protein [Alkalilimnicola ehrlichii]|uniref:ATP-binding cassette domain-containing protein n=1 Tax=Alkalilimnicola ehrlichii TaxID=351052 RepID=UPI0015F2944C
MQEWTGEAGSRLSGGQARRLALARLLISSPDIVLLDEPFSGLDAATAERVRERLQPWLAERTVISFCHEASSAARAGPAYRLEGASLYRLG